MRIAILTISDSRTEATDGSGNTIRDWAAAKGFTVAVRALVPDESDRIVATLIEWADQDKADLILTTGGTGLTARDVTPEATKSVLQKEAPGLAELLRMTAYPKFHKAVLSRGVAGVRGKTLIVNLPGSTGGVKDGLGALDDLVEHAVALVRGERVGH
jgi:molybdenum cofactor synthesis domain-containing protein